MKKQMDVALMDSGLDYFFVLYKGSYAETFDIESQIYHLNRCYPNFYYDSHTNFTYGKVYVVLKVTKRGLYVMTNDLGKTNAYSVKGFEKI